MYKKNIRLLLFLGLIITPYQLQAQCAMCKAVVENGNQSMAEGINSGITYLMVFPYLLVGIIVFFMYRYKKNLKN